MMKNHKIVVIGLDACDPALAQRFAAAGIMPNLAKLLAQSTRAPVSNPHGLFVGALWVNFATALRPDRHGFHCWDKIDPKTYAYQLNSLTHHRSCPPFWRAIGEAGGKVAAIDVPHDKAGEPMIGLHITEWGCHDKHFGFRTWPAELASTIESKFGFHPALRGREAFETRDNAPDDELHRSGRFRTREEDCALLADLKQGVRKKRDLVLDVLNQSDWDLFIAIFGESHAIGHQQWHLHDPAHPRYDAATADALGGDPIAQVYGALDAALGDIWAAASSADMFIVHLSHGMGPHYDATHLLEEVLVRLDRHNSQQAGPTHSRLMDTARPFVPALRGAARALGIPPELRRKLGAAVVHRPETPEQWRARRRYFQEPNNTVYGGVRLNLAGREPAGIVQPEQAGAVIAQLEQDLLALVNADTGGRVVRKVERSDAWHRRADDDCMPDLFLDWERGDPIERVASPKIGEVHVPYDHWRTGDHRPAGMLLAHGAGLERGERQASLAVEDIGPSLAARLSARLTDVDGVIVPWLAGSKD